MDVDKAVQDQGQGATQEASQSSQVTFDDNIIGILHALNKKVSQFGLGGNIIFEWNLY